ncbi:MAG TPA: hypothetical protein DDZ81_17480 [Acetobacteraceae bacterium]|jgi:periplasmic protein TonB|nr:hypothetical protein [Acetobacteraceae bacterium]
MMGHDPISAPEFQRRRLPVTPKGKTARRFLLIAAGLSVLVHILAALTIVFLPRLLPQEPRQQAQGTVELLMVEKQGNVASPPAQSVDSKPSPPQPETKPATPKTEAPPKPPAAEKASKTPPIPTAPDKDATEPAPPTEPPAPKESKQNTKTPSPEPAKEPPKDTPKESKDPAKVAPTPPEPPPQKAPVFDLSGTDSESNATVLGSQVVPASQDDRYRNRPPIYPREAQMRHEAGIVDLLIHVTDTGMTGSVDVMASSGYPVLDHAAIDAVLKWHFRPALKQGRSVPFDLPFRFEFEPN